MNMELCRTTANNGGRGSGNTQARDDRAEDLLGHVPAPSSSFDILPRSLRVRSEELRQSIGHCPTLTRFAELEDALPQGLPPSSEHGRDLSSFNHDLNSA